MTTSPEMTEDEFNVKFKDLLMNQKSQDVYTMFHAIVGEIGKEYGYEHIYTSVKINFEKLKERDK